MSQKSGVFWSEALNLRGSLGSGTERVSGRIYRLCPALGLPEGDISRGTGGDDVVHTLTGTEAPLPPPQPANQTATPN